MSDKQPDPNYPKAMYRAAEEDSGHPVHEVWGHKVHMTTVESKEEEAEAEKAGWSASPPAEKAPKDFKAAAKASAKAAQ